MPWPPYPGEGAWGTQWIGGSVGPNADKPCHGVSKIILPWAR